MKIGEVSSILSEYLGLPSSLIFDDQTQKLSAVCIDELSRVVTLPGSFEFSSSFRPPQIGEYFLDLKALVSENRLLVYKAIQSSEKPSIIMSTPDNTESIQKVGFNLDLCVENANIAYIGPMAVTLLTPYVDSQGYMAVLNFKHRIMLVHVDELSNMLPGSHSSSESSPTITDSFLGITAEEKASVDDLLNEIGGEYLD